MPDIFKRVAHRLQVFLDSLTPIFFENDVAYLQHAFSIHQHHINYNRYATSFACAYLLENYWKIASVFVQEPPPRVKRVTDVGCGSGAAILAYLASVGEATSDSSSTIEICLLDRSKAQLELANKLINILLEEIPQLNVVIRTQCIELHTWHPQNDSTDLLLLGHVLTENPHHVSDVLGKAFDVTSPGHSIYVVERIDDPIWRVIDTDTSTLPLSAMSGVVKIVRKSVQWNKAVLYSNKPRISSRYLCIRLPQEKHLCNLLRLYFVAWGTQSIDVLEKIFRADAEYHEKPFQPPLRGIEEIKAYWADKVLKQSNIRHKILGVAYSYDRVFAEWESSFIREEQQIRLKGSLILLIDLPLTKIVSLHEYFRTQKKSSIDCDF